MWLTLLIGLPVGAFSSRAFLKWKREKDRSIAALTDISSSLRLICFVALMKD